MEGVPDVGRDRLHRIRRREGRLASREEVPKWSMLQVNYKREEVTGAASPPKVGRLRHQTEERNLKLLTD